MLSQLKELMAGPLRKMLADPAHEWRTVDVIYEDPHVERVWTPFLSISGDEHRVSLHRIHPCEKPLYHPHPWPSAMWIVSGTYEMGVGCGYGAGPPPEATTVTLTSGSTYEMLNPRAWHWVRPLGGPVMSVMLTGRPWEMPPEFPKHGKGAAHRELDDVARDDVLRFFRQVLDVTVRP